MINESEKLTRLPHVWIWNVAEHCVNLSLPSLQVRRRGIKLRRTHVNFHWVFGSPFCSCSSPAVRMKWWYPPPPPLPAPPFSFFSSSHGCANLGRAVAADRDANDIIEDGCTESCLPSCLSIQILAPSKAAKYKYTKWGKVLNNIPISEQREIAQLWWKEEAGIDKT